MAGVFLCLDGLDGVGKSTQVARLARWLEARGRQVVCCRDPGGTALGERVRHLLLDDDYPIGMTAEMLLYLASRAQLIDEVIRPALVRERIVVSDRYLLATIVYQGHAGGLDPELVRRIGTESAGGLWPDWIGILDLDPAVAEARRAGPADRIESRSVEFQTRVRAGFLAEARRDPDRVSVVDARGTEKDVHRNIVAEVQRVLAD